jgi:hypothetical protein
MVEVWRLVVDDSRKPQIWHLVAVEGVADTEAWHWEAGGQVKVKDRPKGKESCPC